MNFKPFKLIFAAVTLCAAASASTIFNFDHDSFGTSTAFTDTVSGLSATFTSTADPGGFVVFPGIFNTLTGNVLGDPGPADVNNLALSVAFNQNLSSIALDFATSDFSVASPLTLTAYENATLVGSVSSLGIFPAGFSFPENRISFAGTFNNLVISSTATDFAIDNITVTAAAAPEPPASALLGLGLLAFGICSRRVSRVRKQTSRNQ